MRSNQLSYLAICEGTAPRTWVLGSSVNGARVAGSLGLPFAVASHFE